MAAMLSATKGLESIFRILKKTGTAPAAKGKPAKSGRGTKGKGRGRKAAPAT